MALQRAIIINEEQSDQLPIVVHYNPKEITVDKSVPWQKHPTSEAASPMLEYTAGDGKNLSVELVLDSFERRSDSEPVQATVDRIELLTAVAGIKDKKRPPLCSFVWGGFPKFRGVVESMSVKYVMFHDDGTPCRANVTLKLKQAGSIFVKGQAPNHRKVAEADDRDDVRTAAQR